MALWNPVPDARDAAILARARCCSQWVLNSGTGMRSVRANVHTAWQASAAWRRCCGFPPAPGRCAHNAALIPAFSRRSQRTAGLAAGALPRAARRCRKKPGKCSESAELHQAAAAALRCEALSAAGSPCHQHARCSTIVAVVGSCPRAAPPGMTALPQSTLPASADMRRRCCRHLTRPWF